MDKIKAKKLEGLLQNQNINGYRIESLINNGKSAAVFKTSKNGNPFAIKIFDNELVERFGHEVQIKRIEQEIELNGHEIPGLINIHDGGRTKIDGEYYYYLVMDFIEGKNLKEYIGTEEYDLGLILLVLNILISVSESLLKLGLVHRDIKPENIMVDLDGNIILMDLGVLKLVGAKSFTDNEEKQFIGTLRYAPPEFLLRYEEDTESGWRSVNLYQIGATLHDLIMKKELFTDITPYSNLVISIKEDIPKIGNSEVPFKLIQLTRDMLIKDWKLRAEICSIDRIEKLKDDIQSKKSDSESELEEILKLRSKHEIKYEELKTIQRSNEDKKNKRIDLADKLKSEIDSLLSELKDKGLFNKLEISKNFYFSDDRKELSKTEVRNYLFKLEGDLKIGFPRPLCFLVRTINDDKNFGTVQLLGIFPSIFIKYNLNDPKTLFEGIIKDSNKLGGRGYQNQNLKFELYEAFQGAIQIDNGFREHLKSGILKIIKASLNEVDELVQHELESHEKVVKGEEVSSSIITSSGNMRYKTILIFKEKHR